MLSGTRVIVVGAGLSGLTAALELKRRRANVRVIEARDRVGGRVWSPMGEDGRTRVEAGGEFVDHEHTVLRRLVSRCGLRLARVLHQGFGLALRLNGRIDLRQSQETDWQALTRLLAPVVRAYTADGGSWQSVTAAIIASQSVSALLAARRARPRTRALAEAMRGFYLAEPEELSSLVLIDQVKDGGDPGRRRMYRIVGGSSRLPEAIAARLRGAVLLHHVLRRVTITGPTVCCHVETGSGIVLMEADVVVIAVPAPLVRSIPIEPSLPAAQAGAYAALGAGAATKLSLQFESAWWRRRKGVRAFGTNLPIGSVWDGAEEDRGVALLTCLAGADASATMKALVWDSGASGVVGQLDWLGTPDAARLAAPPVSWEDDPWARGGYAVFGPGFDPRLRPLLAANHGRVVFAGEHTSEKWQGFMNGAVESGFRAAEDVARLVTLDRLGLSSAGPEA
jgi:monoamine oxidase